MHIAINPRKTLNRDLNAVRYRADRVPSGVTQEVDSNYWCECVCAVWRTLVCGQFKCFYFENKCKTISAKDLLQFVESVKVNLCVFSQVSFFCHRVYICGYKFRAKNIWDLNLMISKCGLFVRNAFCHELQRNHF